MKKTAKTQNMTKNAKEWFGEEKPLDPNWKPLDQSKEHISDEELNKIKNLQSKAIYAATLAEKAYSEARVAELEVNNFTLTVYNKYKLVSGKDSITTDGLIIRIEEDTTQEV